RLGVALGDPEGCAADLALVRDALVRALDETSAAALAPRLRHAARGAQRAAPIQPLATAAAAATLREDDEVVLRAHLAAELVDTDDGSTVLVSRAGRLPLTTDERAAVALVLRAGSAAVGDLGLE